MRAVGPVSGRQFAWFRILFGAYLAVHFALHIPYGPELFSREGVPPSARLNPTFGILPNVLARWDSRAFVTVFLIALTAFAILLILGVTRRLIALLLWYGWACLFNRNV